MIEYKTIIKIIIMYSIGNTPLREQDLTAYPLLAHLITKSIITALDRFCNSYLPRLFYSGEGILSSTLSLRVSAALF